MAFSSDKTLYEAANKSVKARMDQVFSENGGAIRSRQIEAVMKVLIDQEFRLLRLEGH